MQIYCYQFKTKLFKFVLQLPKIFQMKALKRTQQACGHRLSNWTSSDGKVYLSEFSPTGVWSN